MASNGDNRRRSIVATEREQREQPAERHRIKERDLWLDRWDHVWTKRQSPEWKPRRASVATCQRGADETYDICCLSQPQLANFLSQRLNEWKSSKLVPPEQACTEEKDQADCSSSKVDLRQQQQEKCNGCCPLENHRRFSEQRETNKQAELIKETDQNYLTLSSHNPDGKVAAKGRVASDSREKNIPFLHPCLDRLSTSADFADKKQVGKASSLVEEAELELATGSQTEDALMAEAVNKKLQLQEKQRKFLIFSMALKQIMTAEEECCASNSCNQDKRHRAISVTTGISQRGCCPAGECNGNAGSGSGRNNNNNQSKKNGQTLKVDGVSHYKVNSSAETGDQSLKTVSTGSRLPKVSGVLKNANSPTATTSTSSKFASSTVGTGEQLKLEATYGLGGVERSKSQKFATQKLDSLVDENFLSNTSVSCGKKNQEVRCKRLEQVGEMPVVENGPIQNKNQKSEAPLPVNRRRTNILYPLPVTRGSSEPSKPIRSNRINMDEQRSARMTLANRVDTCGSCLIDNDKHSGDLETLIVESWLDDHQTFVHDYFMRKASHQMIDDWLKSHAKVSTSTTNLSHKFNHHRSMSTLNHRPSSATRLAQQTLNSHCENLTLKAEQGEQNDCGFRSTRSYSQSAAPIRKISATDFESRSGNGFLRPMVSRTPDGKPTFVSQLDNLQTKGRFCEKNNMNDNNNQNDNNPLKITDQSETIIKSKENDANVEGNDSEDLMVEDGEVKLIFELVKNICNDLDIRTLLHKILKNIAVLINADKSSLFLVCGESSDPKRHLVSQLFNVDQDSDIISESEECITIPWGTGLVGYVAESGESVNIENCYEDPRFTNTIDQRTGYVTRHMLCAPIFDNRNEIVGVAQVINKRDGKPFTKNDETKFKRYLQFCGIGLRNAQSYEHCQLENRRNQVLLDLARMIFEEQSTIEQVVYRIMLHTQSLLECQRCQVLLIDDGSEDLDQLLQMPNSPTNQRAAHKRVSQLHSTTDGSSDEQPKPSWRPQCGDGSFVVSINQDDSLKHSEQRTFCREKRSESIDETSSDCGSFEHIEISAMTSEQQPAKLFSLVFDLECGGNDLVVHSNKDGKQVECQEQLQQQKTDCSNVNKGDRQFPINIGITGYVAMTGETLNIEDAHKSDRFDPSVDEGTDFRHKSILCMPIRNGQRQIIGVSQLINKKNGRPFNKNDENLFEAFAIFCGLGIHNTLMYERVLKIMAKQRVTFEVLSYHATAPLEEAKKLNLEQIPSCFALNLTSLKFNDFSLDEQYMLKSCLRFFLDLDLIRRFQIDQLVFCNWILSVQKNYRKVTYHPVVGGTGLKASPVRYHNWRHAFNVSQMMFAILINTQICQALGELETLALLIACLCHDLDHRGTNNSFQIKSASPLAELYSTSTMEHHHFDQCVMILNSQGNQILANLSPEEYSRVIGLLEEAILATDLAKYFQKRELFFQLVNSNQFDWQNNSEHRSLLRCMLMTACDVAAITKPWPVQKVVADLVMSEFYQQGDIERQELNIEPIDMMNRDKMSKLPEMQIGFIDSICAPIYTAFARLFPRELGSLLEGCLTNRDLWTEMAKNDDIRLGPQLLSSCLSNSTIPDNNQTIGSMSALDRYKLSEGIRPNEAQEDGGVLGSSRSSDARNHSSVSLNLRASLSQG